MLEDMLSKLSEQVQRNASQQETEGLNEIPGLDTTVDNLLTGGVEKSRKRLDST